MEWDHYVGDWRFWAGLAGLLLAVWLFVWWLRERHDKICRRSQHWSLGE